MLPLLSVLLLLGCSRSGEAALDAAFRFDKDGTCANFVTFTALDAEDADCTWTFSDEPSRTYTGAVLVHYFPRRGTYEATLRIHKDGASGEKTLRVGIAEDSWYTAHGEELAWNDEFNGSRISTADWNYDLGQGNDKWGNNELQNYTAAPQNAFLRDGTLVIKAIMADARQEVGSYTSARLTTNGKHEIHRGRVEVRAKMPSGRGTWAGIWLYGRKAQPSYSELDMMEYVGCDKGIVYTTVHTSATLGGSQAKSTAAKTVPDAETAFHTYGMDWQDGRIDFYLDHPDNVYHTFTPASTADPDFWPFDKDKDLYLILNLAVGGDWGGMRGIDDTIWPQELVIDYVRLFRKE